MARRQPAAAAASPRVADSIDRPASPAPSPAGTRREKGSTGSTWRPSRVRQRSIDRRVHTLSATPAASNSSSSFDSVGLAAAVGGAERRQLGADDDRLVARSCAVQRALREPPAARRRARARAPRPPAPARSRRPRRAAPPRGTAGSTSATIAAEASAAKVARAARSASPSVPAAAAPARPRSPRLRRLRPRATPTCGARASGRRSVIAARRREPAARGSAPSSLHRL